MSMRELLDEPISKYIIRDFYTIGADKNIVEAAKLMKEKEIDSIIVMEDKKPVGMLTIKDIIYKVVSEGKDPKKTKIEEIASKPLITVDPKTKVGEAIKLMLENDIRRLPVIDSGILVGVVILRTVCGYLVEKRIPLVELENPEGVSCPYCGSIFKTREELSKHIDRVHIGVGILEGTMKRRE
ncbi:MAG: CBS domain-containing protein [Nitrososphaerota archaeon]